ncbi:MAG: DsbA family oxidoreductase [Bacilli bacterium]
MIKTDVWSDFACPFCWIGKRRLDKAISLSGVEVVVTQRSFELDPYAPKRSTQSITALLAEKYNITTHEVMQMNERIAEQAKNDGITFDFDNLIPANTFDAHALHQYSRQFGKDAEISEALFHGYFTGGLCLSDHETLLDLAVSNGLNRDEVHNMLLHGKFASAVKNDELYAKRLGITGVPYFLLNDSVVVRGAQTVETLVAVLKELHTSTNITSSCDTQHCDM